MSAANKPTPEPWFVIKSGTSANPRYIISSISGDIAEILPLKDDAAANAALIATAPDIIVLKDIVQRYIDGDMDALELGEELRELFEIREAFACIAKKEGSQS